jgi:hypothetical protein
LEAIGFGRKKLLQVLEAFKYEPVESNKMLCTPCSNCEGKSATYLNIME